MMDKKTKKKLDSARQKLLKTRKMLANIRQQCDDPSEITELEAKIQAYEAEIEKLKAQG